MEENKLVLESLSRNILPTELMNSLVSFKDSNKKKNTREDKKPKKLSMKF